MKFTTVILDADGVMNKNVPLDLAYLGISEEQVSAFFHQSFQECLLGTLDIYDALRPYLAEWKWKGSADDLLHYWFTSGHQIQPAIQSAVLQLRANGIAVHLASNQERLRAEYMKDAMGYKELFDELYISSEMGVKKPDRVFFEKMARNLQEKDLSKILFWDDMQKNIDSARACGFNAELFTDEESFAAVMQLHFPFLT